MRSATGSCCSHYFQGSTAPLCTVHMAAKFEKQVCAGVKGWERGSPRTQGITKSEHQGGEPGRRWNETPAGQANQKVLSDGKKFTACFADEYNLIPKVPYQFYLCCLPHEYIKLNVEAAFSTNLIPLLAFPAALDTSITKSCDSLHVKGMKLLEEAHLCCGARGHGNTKPFCKRSQELKSKEEEWMP